MNEKDLIKVIKGGGSVRCGDTGHGQAWGSDGSLAGIATPRQVRWLRSHLTVKEVWRGLPRAERRVIVNGSP